MADENIKEQLNGGQIDGPMRCLPLCALPLTQASIDSLVMSPNEAPLSVESFQVLHDGVKCIGKF